MRQTPPLPARRVAWPLVVVLGIALVAIAAFFGMRALSSHGEAPSTNEQAAGIVVEQNQTEAANATSPNEASDSNSSTASAAEDPRSAAFAVDPSRTDWNFENSDSKTVYLTFDDGPSENTARVLDILDQYDIKATFFVTGINPEYFPMIRECYQRGHTIGLHTYTHDYEQVYASIDAYWADLAQIGEVVEEQIGYVPCFIRFPGGSSNTISANYTQGIMSQLAVDVVDAGYQYYDWDASCGDGAEHSADELVEATKADTAYGYQNIVFLAHDGAGKATTVEALPRIIEYFQSEGYSFAPLDRQTRVPHHGIGN